MSVNKKHVLFVINILYTHVTLINQSINQSKYNKYYSSFISFKQITCLYYMMNCSYLIDVLSLCRMNCRHIHYVYVQILCRMKWRYMYYVYVYTQCRMKWRYMYYVYTLCKMKYTCTYMFSHRAILAGSGSFILVSQGEDGYHLILIFDADGP